MYIHANTTTTTATATRTPTTTTKLRRPWRLSPAAAARCYGRKTFTLRPEQSPVPPCARKCYPGIRARRALLPPMRWASALGLQHQTYLIIQTDVRNCPPACFQGRTCMKSSWHRSRNRNYARTFWSLAFLAGFTSTCLSSSFAVFCLGFVVENTTPAATEKFHIESRSSTSKT